MIGGVFAIICRLLEHRSTPGRASQQAKGRGLLGWLAIIAAIAAIVLALMSITKSRVELQTVSGGTIDEHGTIINQIGRGFIVKLEGGGNVRITFDAPFKLPPVALATAHRGVHATAVVRIESIARQEILLTIRHVGTNQPLRDSVSFMVLESTTASQTL